MTDQQIVEFLKANPSMDIHTVARQLGLPSRQVSIAQHEHLARHMEKHRNSPYWNQRFYKRTGSDNN